MSRSPPIHSGNTLLAALLPQDFDRLRPYLTRHPIARGDVLVGADARIDHVYFLEAGVASIVTATGSHRSTEVGIFGREGVSATCLLLGSDRSPHETFIQVGSGTAWRIEAAAYLEALDASVTLHRTLLRFVQVMLVQGAYSTASNAHQRIEARLARWLLMCHDRIDGDDILLTHELMGGMIAAERSGVTISLHVLEGAGMIRATRGCVTVVDRATLKELAGDSYGVPEAEYRHLLGPLGIEAELEHHA